MYPVESQLFDLTFLGNHVLLVTPGKTEAVTDGFWAFLEPLPVGSHEIDFSASTIDPSGVNNYNTQVKYHLIVEEPTNSTIYRNIIDIKNAGQRWYVIRLA